MNKNVCVDDDKNKIAHNKLYMIVHPFWLEKGAFYNTTDSRMTSCSKSSLSEDSSWQMQPTLSPEALHAPARYNNPQTVKYLIEKGVAIDEATIVQALVGQSTDGTSTSA